MPRRPKPAKAKVKAKPSPTAPPRESSRVRDLEKRLAEALKREGDALEQQTATAEILRVISSSPTETQPVFDAIAEQSARLCHAQFSSVFRFDGALIHLAAHNNFSPDSLRVVKGAFPRPPSDDTGWRGLCSVATSSTPPTPKRIPD